MMGLIQLADFRTYLSINNVQDVPGDLLLQAALDAAEEAIGELCQRQFVVAGVSASTRQYAPPPGAVLRVHDCVEITAVNGGGLDGYQPEPVAGLSMSGQARPFEQIRSFTGWPCSRPGEASVSVTARWGWASIPARVLEANRVLAKDVVANRGINFGIAGITDTTAVRARENPQVLALLAGVRRAEAMSGIG